MLLAAGRGQRMRPLTDVSPKPLLAVQGRSLLAHQFEGLGRAGVTRAVINTGWLGEQISARFGPEYAVKGPSGERRQLSISYSVEPQQALETGGGIARALPMLGPVFWLLASDVYAPDFDFPLARAKAFAASGKLAHLWLVPRPDYLPCGDFGLGDDGLALDLPPDTAQTLYTYSTRALLRAELFAKPWCDIPAGNPEGVVASVVPLLRAAMARGLVSAEFYSGRWMDVGTPERLAQINAHKP